MLLSIIAISAILLHIYLAVKKPEISLLSAPIVSLALAIMAYNIDDQVSVLLAPLIFLVTYITLALSSEEPGKPGWPYSLARWFFLFIGVSFSLLLAIINFPSVYGLLFFVFLIALIINYNIISRHSLTIDILSTINTSMRQNLPLPMALESAAAGQDYKKARILQKISGWLSEGLPLSEALKNGFRRCPGHIVALIAMAEQINQVPLALNCIQKDILEKTREKSKIKPIQPLYPLILLSVTYSILTGIMIFVIPKFKTIFADFEVDLPLQTHIMMKFFMVSYPWFLSLVGFLTFAVFPLMIYTWFRPRRPEKPHLLSIFGDLVKWFLPMLRWFEANYSLIQVVECLHLSLNGGCSVDKAIDNTLTLDVNFYFKKRLRHWSEKVRQGENISAAARQCRMGRGLIWAFDQNLNQPDTPVVLEMLENVYRTNYNYRASLVHYITWPLVTLFIAMMVGSVIYSIFSPMVEIINHTASMFFP
ncbi:MAG: type II secretion system F family protein [Sedimentisphaerales bacterium]|nr:type II secretion system F family protein [Sedimentisphaerales bacterium]